MTDKKISELASNGALDGSELIEVVQSSTNKKALLSALKSFIYNARYSINAQTGTTYTVVSDDVTHNGSVIVKCTNAASITVTVPTPATLSASVGDSVNIRQGGAGAITLSGTISGATTTSAQYETFTLIAESGSSWMRVGG